MFAAGTLGTLGLSLAEKVTPRRILGSATLALVGVIGLILTLDTIISRFHDQGNQASGELREVMKDASRAMNTDHPLGAGWNNYGLLINPPYRYAEIYYDWYRGRGQKPDYSKANGLVESHYYLLIAENGYLGLWAWLLLICVGLWRNLRGFFAFGYSFLRCLSLGIFLGCALNYVQSTLERVLVQPRNLMLWLILLGVTARIEMMRREAKKTKQAAKTNP
jgi:hypothetical protein